jgi:hypothetical protein
MKFFLAIFLIVGVYACGDDSGEAKPVSTVDSSVIDPGDSLSPMMYLDTQSVNDTSFDIALDSAGPMVTADDTSMKR